jgi:methylated-DNA-protein-cysteine methyltransferase-like protein
VPKSSAFVRIKADVLKIVAAIPYGRLTTYRSIGQHLDVMPRHVAYILSQLDAADKLAYPWHRVVGDGGRLGVIKRHADGRPQEKLLTEEGHRIEGDEIASRFLEVFVEAAELDSGVPRQTRPAPDSLGEKAAAKPRRRQ